MTTEEREMILNLTYLELAEKFRNEPQVLIKFLRDEQKKDIDNDTKYIIEILTSLILIIIEDYYLEDDSFNELLIELHILTISNNSTLTHKTRQPQLN